MKKTQDDKISPGCDEIAQARLSAEMTQKEAAALLYSHVNTWSQWENGLRKMHPAFFELFIIKSSKIKEQK